MDDRYEVHFQAKINPLFMLVVVGGWGLSGDIPRGAHPLVGGVGELLRRDPNAEDKVVHGVGAHRVVVVATSEERLGLRIVAVGRRNKGGDSYSVAGAIEHTVNGEEEGGDLGKAKRETVENDQTTWFIIVCMCCCGNPARM